MPPGPPYYVYILSNPARTVLYIGMTNGLRRRLREHRTGAGSAFVETYNATDLVYFERYDTPRAAVEREKQLKRWRRDKKDALIRRANPDVAALPPPVA
jgi:predicted GIY-YIG superfamily endonuclease